MSFRLRLGVYWDEHGYERPCGIVEMVGVDESRSRLMVLDVRTGERILDPVEAIPIEMGRA